MIMEFENGALYGMPLFSVSWILPAIERNLAD
jgi:hypothetical protein